MTQKDDATAIYHGSRNARLPYSGCWKPEIRQCGTEPGQSRLARRTTRAKPSGGLPISILGDMRLSFLLFPNRILSGLDKRGSIFAYPITKQLHDFQFVFRICNGVMRLAVSVVPTQHFQDIFDAISALQSAGFAALRGSRYRFIVLLVCRQAHDVVPLVACVFRQMFLVKGRIVGKKFPHLVRATVDSFSSPNACFLSVMRASFSEDLSSCENIPPTLYSGVIM